MGQDRSKDRHQRIVLWLDGHFKSWVNSSYDPTHTDKHPHTHMPISTVEKERWVQSSDHICTLQPLRWRRMMLSVCPLAPRWQEISHRPSNHHLSCLHWYFLSVSHDELEAVVKIILSRWIVFAIFHKTSESLFLRWIKAGKLFSKVTMSKWHNHSCVFLQTPLFSVWCDDLLLCNSYDHKLFWVTWPLNKQAEGHCFPGASTKTSYFCAFFWGQKKESIFHLFLGQPKEEKIEIWRPVLWPGDTVQRSLHLLTHKKWSSWAQNLKGTFMSLWFPGAESSDILPFRVDLKENSK